MRHDVIRYGVSGWFLQWFLNLENLKNLLLVLTLHLVRTGRFYRLWQAGKHLGKAQHVKSKPLFFIT